MDISLPSWLKNVSPVGLLVFDETQHIISANPEAERLFHRKLNDLEYPRCGDFLGCINRLMHPGGCGKSERCISCVLNAAIRDALHEGKTTLNREAEAIVDIEGGQEQIFLQFSVEAVKINDSPHIVVALYDITQHRQIELKLQKSLSLLNTVGETAKIGGWEWNVDTMSGTWTAEMYRIFEVPIGQKPDINDAINFYHPEEREKISEAIRRAIEEHEPYDQELRFITAQNRHLWVRSLCKPVLENGKTKRLLGVFQDITEKKQAEAILQIRINLGEFAAGHSLHEVLQKTLDEVEKLTESNIAFYHFIEPDQKTIVPQAWSTRTIREFCQAKSKGMSYSIDEAGVWVDCVHQRKPVIHNDYASLPHRKGMPPGHAAVVRELVVPIIKSGLIVAILGVGNKSVDYTEKDVEIVSFLADVAWNIVERKKADQALQEKTEEIERYFSTALDLFCIADTDGNFKHLNRQWENLLGYKLEELEGKRFLEFVHPADLEPTLEAVSRLAAQEQVLNFINRYRCKDGSYRWLEWRSYPSGKVIFAAARDVTDRKAAEEQRDQLGAQLQQAMKMEAIGRLAGGVAHDFNNLLTGIAGYTDLLISGLKPGDPMMNDLMEIQKAAQSAADLARQLLAFSRKQLIEPRVLNLNDLISSLHKMLARLIGEDIELKTILGKQLGSVKADPGQIEQILVNLAINARDAMPNGGKLIIETANVELDESYRAIHLYIEAGLYVMLGVSDTGHGMSKEVKSHLFEPFFTTKPKGRGTGLGLATIYGAVKQSGGSIEVYSEEGKGASFKIYLPRIMEAPEQIIKKSRVSSEMPGGDETILLVEDEHIVRELAIRILKRLQYRVLHAPDGIQAIAVAKEFKEPINLMITDVIMPGMNGRELADRLIQIHPEMKILYTSGYTENVIAHHGVLNENLNFIGKPYSSHDLAKIIRKILD